MSMLLILTQIGFLLVILSWRYLEYMTKSRTKTMFLLLIRSCWTDIWVAKTEDISFSRRVGCCRPMFLDLFRGIMYRYQPELTKSTMYEYFYVENTDDYLRAAVWPKCSERSSTFYFLDQQTCYEILWTNFWDSFCLWEVRLCFCPKLSLNGNGKCCIKCVLSSWFYVEVEIGWYFVEENPICIWFGAWAISQLVGK